MFLGDEVAFDEGVFVVPNVDLRVVEEVVAELLAQFFGEVFLLAVAEVVEEGHGGEEPGGLDEVGEIGAVVGDAFGADDLAAVFAAPVAADDVAEDVFGGFS